MMTQSDQRSSFSLSKVADWVTIVTAPLSLLSAAGTYLAPGMTVIIPPDTPGPGDRVFLENLTLPGFMLALTFVASIFCLFYAIKTRLAIFIERNVAEFALVPAHFLLSAMMFILMLNPIVAVFYFLRFPLYSEAMMGWTLFPGLLWLFLELGVYFPEGRL